MAKKKEEGNGSVAQGTPAEVKVRKPSDRSNPPYYTLLGLRHQSETWEVVTTRPSIGQMRIFRRVSTDLLKLLFADLRLIRCKAIPLSDLDRTISRPRKSKADATGG